MGKNKESFVNKNYILMILINTLYTAGYGICDYSSYRTWNYRTGNVNDTVWNDCICIFCFVSGYASYIRKSGKQDESQTDYDGIIGGCNIILSGFCYQR